MNHPSATRDGHCISIWRCEPTMVRAIHTAFSTGCAGPRAGGSDSMATSWVRVQTACTVGAFLLAAASSASTPAQRCQQGKNKEAGKYAYCRQKVEARFAAVGDAAARTSGLQKCLDKYALKWPLL